MAKVPWRLLVLPALGILIRHPPGQRAVNLGSIEDPAAAQAYLAISGFPQFRAIRWLVCRKVMEWPVAGTLVDLGSGPGMLALQLASDAPERQVVGVEPSEEMVELATANAHAAGLSNRVSFKVGTAESIPLPDGSVDQLVSTMSLHHWDDPVAGLREIKRVVRPGGQLLVVDLRRDPAILFWLLVQFAQRVVVPSPLRRAGEPSGSVKSAFTPAEAEEIVREAGLENAKVTSGPVWLAVESAS